MTQQYNDIETPAAPRRFRRNKIDGVLGGVCAGIGDYTGLDPIIVRIGAVATFLFTGGFIFWVYIALWVFVPKDHRAPYRRDLRDMEIARKTEQARSRHKGASGTRKGPVFSDVKSKFRSLEMRLADMERAITSSEWQLRRDFKDLEG